MEMIVSAICGAPVAAQRTARSRSTTTVDSKQGTLAILAHIIWLLAQADMSYMPLHRSANRPNADINTVCQSGATMRNQVLEIIYDELSIDHARNSNALIDGPRFVRFVSPLPSASKG